MCNALSKRLLTAARLMAALALTAAAGGCSSDQSSASASERTVVVYCALDQMFSEPLLRRFERETGIRVQAVFDVEASKTIGLVNRLLAEQSAPVADVFWNNEILQTLVLKKKGVIEPYRSPSAADIPAQWKDPGGFWTGFAARARVIIYNTELIPDESQAPASLADFLKPEYSGRCAIANPLFGTTSTHTAALFAAWGPQRARDFFYGLKNNGVLVLAGNATVRDQVAQGEIFFGLTDTDDAVGAILNHKPVRMVFPDQNNGGTLLIPNTVALVKGAPHPEEARRLIDFILSPAVEETLAQGRSAQIPLRPGVASSPHLPATDSLRFMQLHFEDVLPWREQSVLYLRSEFLSSRAPTTGGREDASR
ncbi:MAG: extracellular solute-binding protein [Candidatus Sumerlaeia bacterium]